MVIGLEDRLSRFLEVVVVAELVGDVRKHGGDGGADGLLPVRDDAADGYRQCLLDFPQQGDQIPLRRTQETACQQHLARETLADHPQYLMTPIRLEAIQRQDHPPLGAEAFS